MRSSWMRVGPKPNDWCPYKQKEREAEHTEIHTHTQMTNSHVETKAETGTISDLPVPTVTGASSVK